MRGSSGVVFTCPGHCLLLGGVLCPPCVIVMMQRVRSWKRMCVNWKGVRNKKGCRTQQFLMQVKVGAQYPASDWRNYMILSGNLQLKSGRLFQKEQRGSRHDMPLLSTDPAADLCLLISRAFQNLVQAGGSVLIIVGSAVLVQPCLQWLGSSKQPPARHSNSWSSATAATASCFIRVMSCITQTSFPNSCSLY